MATIKLEGDTLGQKHRSFNSLVNTAATENTYILSKVSYGESDIQNLLRIDVACIRRKVDYILDVIKGNDMLYVSRALKGSSWLVTDDRYANIINLEYLHNRLFPKMTTKAKNKMLIFIRIHLKNPARSEAFFKYYQENMSIAQHWLRHCSVEFIRNIILKHADEISFSVMKNLCKKSTVILKCYLNSHARDCSLFHRYLLQGKREEIVDILDLLYSANQRVPMFGKRFTRSLMKRYPDILIEHFEKYYSGIHMSTFVKYLKKEDIENILMKYIQKDSMKIFFRYDNLKHFLRYIPETQRLQLIKTIMSPKENVCSSDSASRLTELKGALGFLCYELVPFEYAFPELKVILSEESSQFKRNSILSILILSARRNPRNIHTLLRYYCTQHMNDSLEYKVKFLNKLLLPIIIHKFDQSIWAIVYDMLINIEHYDFDKYAPKFLDSLIMHKLLQHEHIPDWFMKKVNFKSFFDYQPHLDATEAMKVLDFVYDSCFTKICKTDIVDEEDMRIALDLVICALLFLEDWNKGPADYPCMNNIIREIIKIKVANAWDIDLSMLYKANKLFKRNLLEESILLCPCDETFVNILKHNPELLWRYRDNLVVNLSLKRTLKKLRIYWPKSTVQQWVNIYLKCLQQTSNHKSFVQGLCILLPRPEAMCKLIQKYAPTKTNATKSEDISNNELSIGQNVVKCLYLIRPSVDEKALLMYAEKEYLPYLLNSFDVILRNQSYIEFWNVISVLLDNEFLHRHAVRLVHLRLKENVEIEGFKPNNFQQI